MRLKNFLVFLGFPQPCVLNALPLSRNPIGALPDQRSLESQVNAELARGQGSLLLHDSLTFKRAADHEITIFLRQKIQIADVATAYVTCLESSCAWAEGIHWRG
jgi:hypothetical protein